VAQALGDYPPTHDANGNPVYYQGDGADTQIFRLQQQGIGELLTVRVDGQRLCQSYAGFCAKLADVRYKNLLGPAYRLIDRLAPGQKRWHRLKTVDTALLELIEHCNRVLNLHRP
jgi:hypothetical protein